MAISLVQHHGSDNDGTTSTTSATTMGSAMTVGNVAIVGFGMFDSGTLSSVLSISDNGSGGTNSYSLVKAIGVGGTGRVEIWSASITKSAATVVTATLNATQQFRPISVAEFSGVSSATAESTNSASGSTTSASSGNVTPNEANALVFGIAMFGSGTISTGTNFTTIDNLQLTPDGTEYQIPTSASALAATFTCTGSNWVCAVAVFTPTASGSVPPDDDSYLLLPRVLPDGNVIYVYS